MVSTLIPHADPYIPLPPYPSEVATVATPEKPAGEAAPKAEQKKKPVREVKARGKGKRLGKKSARQIAVEILNKHGGTMKFGELTKEVTARMGGKLTWTPTYYMNSPGFSKPEHGVVRYSASDEKKGREKMVEERKARLAARPKKAKKAKAPKVKKGKAPKGETVLERRTRTAAEKKAREEQTKKEFDEAAAAKEEEEEEEEDDEKE